ncbi:MAG TPA: hypothetical protein VGG75_38060 [Trebonia sp.]
MTPGEQDFIEAMLLAYEKGRPWNFSDPTTRRVLARFRREAARLRQQAAGAEERPARDAGWRAWVTGHLHHHPDHAGSYPAGHDFTFRSTADVGREHERLHAWPGYLGSHHEHDRPWYVTPGDPPGDGSQGGNTKEESMSDMSKSLDLNVTVTCAPDDPDAVLAKMIARSSATGLPVRLQLSPYSLKVTKAERADGQQAGLAVAFEEYWAQDNSGTNWSYGEKDAARKAFMHGVEHGSNGSSA